jgi:hypothetical protein
LAESESYHAVDESSTQTQIDQYQLELDQYQLELDELHGVNTNILSLIDIQSAYHEAQLALDSSGLQTQVDYYNAEIERLASIDSNIISLAATLGAYQQSILAGNGVSAASDPFAGDSIADAWNRWLAIGGNIFPADWPALGFYATGGIASGPASGYPVMLHGTEAVIPLSGGRSVPVDIDNREVVKALNELTAMVKQVGIEQIKSGKKSVKLLDKIDRLGLTERAA